MSKKVRKADAALQGSLCSRSTVKGRGESAYGNNE